MGEQVVYDALSTASTGVQAVLYSASGTQVFNIDANNDTGPGDPARGELSPVLEGTQAAGGAFTFQFLDAGAAPVCSLDGTAPVTGTLTPGVADDPLPRRGQCRRPSLLPPR